VSAPGGSAPGRRNPLAWLAALAVVAFGFSLCRRGIVLSDEGYLLLQALDMTHGRVPYRDMDSFVTPGVWIALSTLFRIVEPSVIASRMLALAGWCATVWVTWRIVRREASPAFAAATVGIFLVASVWAFPAWTWSFYSPYAVLFALAALDRILVWRRHGGNAEPFWIGLLLGLAIVFKQNYGALALAGSAAGMAAIALELRGAAGARLRGGWSAAAGLAAGLAAVGLPLLGWLAEQGALAHAFEALVIHPFGGFLGTHDIAYLGPEEMLRRDRMAGLGRLTYGAFAFTHTAMRFAWPDSLVRAMEILHVLLYWLPPLVFATALCVAILPAIRGLPLDGALAAMLAVSGLVYLGVFPRADFNHLVNVYQPVLVLAAVVLHRLLPPRGVRRSLPGRCVLAAGALLLGAYAAVAIYWYVDLMRTLDSEVRGRRGGVLVSAAERDMLDYEVRTIRSLTRDAEPVLTVPGLAMLNFLAERPMPSRYYNHYAVHIVHDQGAGVVEGVEASRLRLAVADYHDFFSERNRLRDYAPVLTDHLRRQFRPLFSVAIDEHLFLARRDDVLPAGRTASALSDCDADAFEWGRGRGIRSHLLFDILYHFDEAKRADVRDLSTLCRVALPEAARLRFRIGYRQPTRVEPGSDLVAEIWVRPVGSRSGAVRVHAETLPLLPVQGWASPPADERVVDLSRWSGSDVVLVFRTVLRGRVHMNELDMKGFAAVWQDPQIEFE
jgi:hypothetical protein